MNNKTSNFCFCTLALGKKYRDLTKQLAEDLAKYSPNTFLFVYTDEPKDFSNYSNILAFKHRQQGILLCYHDKRLVMAEALKKFSTAIYFDADTRIISHVPNDIHWQPGITAGHCENLIEHVSKYNSERLQAIKNVASKLGIPLETTNYIGESLFVITKDAGREKEFLKYWGKIGRFLEFQGVHSGEGNTMGLAAAKVGWNIKKDGWQAIKDLTQHLDASDIATTQTLWDKLKVKFGYYYRLTVAKLMALQDVKFFYF